MDQSPLAAAADRAQHPLLWRVEHPMAEHTQTSRRTASARVPEPPRSPGPERSAAGTDRLAATVNANPAAREAAARGNALSLARSNLALAPAVQMKSGPVVQMGKSKQEKDKARVQGEKKSKEKKTQQVVNTMTNYQSGNKNASNKDIRKAVDTVQKEKKNVRTGHGSQDSSHKMNQGTKGTVKAVTEQLKKQANEKEDEEDLGTTRKRLPKDQLGTDKDEDDSSQ
jgi:hypothetical protein